MCLTRILHMTLPSGVVEVPVTLSWPREQDGHWVCEYEIGWPDAPHRSYAAGLDAIQAFELALQGVGIVLNTSQPHDAGVLYWEAPGKGYGFPVPKNARHLLTGDDARFM